MRFASVFFLAVLFVTVQSAPVDSSPLRHDPSAHEKPGPVEDKPANGMPAASMENDSEPEMSHDMPMTMDEDKEMPNGKPDKESEKPDMSEDKEHEDGHEGHDDDGHEGHDDDGHEGHDHASHASHGEKEEGSEESHEGHDHSSHGSDDSHGSHGHSESEMDSNEGSTVVADSEDTPEPSSEPEEGVCIGATHLNGFASHELVFEKHVLARVLCDVAGSCATHGHIVNYKGSSMMMGRYCDIVGCEKKVMEVNSPRYQRGLKVPSESDGMHFTAFAARFETRGEEAVLAAAVRAGF